MYTVGIISQKGGAGKTTIALNLAIAAIASERAGHSSLLIDLDPQASATKIGDIRNADAPVIESIQAARLSQLLEVAEANGVKFAIIDTAPHTETDALATLKAADLVLIPCRPAVLDLQAIERTANLVGLANTNAIAVLNAVPPTSKLGDQATQAIEQYKLPVAPIRLSQRAAYYHAFSMGLGVQEYEPKGKAAQEVKQLYKFVKHHLNTLEK